MPISIKPEPTAWILDPAVGKWRWGGSPEARVPVLGEPCPGAVDGEQRQGALGTGEHSPWRARGPAGARLGAGGGGHASLREKPCSTRRIAPCSRPGQARRPGRLCLLLLPLLRPPYLAGAAAAGQARRRLTWGAAVGAHLRPGHLPGHPERRGGQRGPRVLRPACPGGPSCAGDRAAAPAARPLRRRFPGLSRASALLQEARQAQRAAPRRRSQPRWLARRRPGASYPGRRHRPLLATQ